jgi:hypothetical protein
VSRTGMYIAETIGYKRRRDLESNETSIVAITTKMKGVKPFNIIGYYRQWQCPSIEGQLNSTETVQAQLYCYHIALNKIRTAQKEQRETIAISDMNLNSNVWGLPSAQLGQHNRKLIPLYKLLKEKLLNDGFTLINTKSTRWATAKKESCIDHLMTTCPEKIRSHQLINTGASDHRICIYYQSNTKTVERSRYMIRRAYKDFNQEQFEEEIQKDPRYIQTLQSQDNGKIGSNGPIIKDTNLYKQKNIYIEGNNSPGTTQRQPALKSTTARY